MGCNTSSDAKPAKDAKEDAQENHTNAAKEVLKVDESEEQAATKIQAAFRGHQTRKSISMKTSKQQQPEPEPSRAELEAEFRADDKGDSGYPQRPWLMTPFMGVTPESPEAAYNQRHMTARVVIENTFGRLKNRWRCLSKDRVLHYKPEKCAKIVQACCVLYNIALQFNVPEPEYTDLCNAATKIQASFRGHQARKVTQEQVAKDLQDQQDKEDIEKIDLADPDLNKAATKIQASFRGHKVRKDVPN